MSMPTTPVDNPAKPIRRRLSREGRFVQLIGVSWQLIADEGTDALTLGRLAEAAGITKPTVYEHFGSRHGLLTALYEDYDARQHKIIDEAIAASKPDLEDKARVIAISYVDCVLAEGREIPDLLAALSGSPELSQLRRACQLNYIGKCQLAFAPFTGQTEIPVARLWAMLGAADTLSLAAVTGDITDQQAYDELIDIILSLVHRSQQQ
jgi:AcrR family transcriptional regulator